MFRPTLLERIVHKVDEKTIPLFAGFKRAKLNNTDFTIISNNCWGGVCYNHFGIKKLSPTVGCFIMTDDYLKFITNLNYYLEQELKIIRVEDARHYPFWKEDSCMKNVPIGVLDDVEIAFLHYKDSEVAKDTWNRRAQRVNRSNLIFKFSYMNQCTKEDLDTFIEMQLPGKKLCFVKDAETAKKDRCLVYYKGFEKDNQISNDTYYWDRYFDVVKFINQGIVAQRM